MGIWQGIKRASKAMLQGPGPGNFVAAGKRITCPHCGQDTFIEGSVLLNSLGMTYPGLDWAQKSATSLMCDECGHVELFGTPPKRE